MLEPFLPNKDWLILITDGFSALTKDKNHLPTNFKIE
jgi:hypothetical protein